MPVKYEDVRLTCCENGYVLSYCERRTKKDSYENSICNYKQKIFKEDEVTEAVAEMKAMHNGNKNSDE